MDKKLEDYVIVPEYKMSKTAAESDAFQTLFGLSAKAVLRNKSLHNNRFYHFFSFDDMLLNAHVMNPDNGKAGVADDKKVGAKALIALFIYRNNLRQTFYEIIGYHKKKDDFDFLNRQVNKIKKGETVDAYETRLTTTFIGKKIERYDAFMKCLCDFALMLTHNLYYKGNTSEMERVGQPLQHVFKRCLKLVEPIKTQFESELDEEFNTEDVEDIFFPKSLDI